MTNKEKEILHYLISNSNDKGEISISDKDLADNCNTTTTTVRTFKSKAQKENIFKYENKKYTIPNDIKVDYSYIVDGIVKDKGLKYSTTEKNVFGYVTDRYNTIQDDDGYTYSTLEYIGKACGITDKSKLIKILNKLVADGLIDMIKGDFNKKQATKFRVIYPIINNNPTINNTPNIENSPTIENNANNTININIDNEILNQILNKVTQLEQQNNDIKQSLHKIHDKFSSVEQCFDMLIDYINEVRSDVDNLYYIQNIQKVKNECAVTIEEIRKVLDK